MNSTERVGIVLARTGSTRLKEKNLLKIGGKTLTEKAVEAGIGAGLKVILSSNSENILEHITHNGVTKYLRTEKNSDAFATSESAVLETINELQIADSCEIVLLQPTSPMRSSATVSRFLAEWDSIGVSDSYDSAFSATLENSESWVKVNSNFVRLSSLIYPNEQFTRSQDRPPIYIENGAIYLTRAVNIRNGDRFICGNKYVFLCNKYESVDIDTFEDFEFARTLSEL